MVVGMLRPVGIAIAVRLVILPINLLPGIESILGESNA